MNKIQILYLDDESINLQLFEINFSKTYEVYTTTNALSAIEILHENPHIKIIISDMKMPGMNGIQFITKAKGLFPDKKFFILTGFEINEEIQNALDSGLIFEYFSKPFDLEEIEASIKKALKEIK